MNVVLLVLNDAYRNHMVINVYNDWAWSW